MSSSNKVTRDEAIPFMAEPWNGSRGADILYETLDHSKIISSDLIVPVRLCTPSHMNLVEMHLTIIMSVSPALSVKIGIGEWLDNISAKETEQNIEIMHHNITGSNDPIESSAGTLLIDGVNLLPFLPKRGDSNFREDGFILLLKFSRARNISDDSIVKFEAIGSALAGLI